MLLFRDHITLRSGAGIAISIVAAYYYRHLKSTDQDGSSDIEERNATMQILQSSQLAHRSIRHSGASPYSVSSFTGNYNQGMYSGVGDGGYVGVDTEFNVPHSAMEDEIEALLFDAPYTESADFNPMNTSNGSGDGYSAVNSNDNGSGGDNTIEIEMAPLNGAEKKDIEN